MSEHEHSHGAHGLEHAGGKFKALITKKVGPLPLGVWMLAVGGGLGIAYYIHAKNTATVDDGTGDTTSGTEDGSQGGNTATQAGAGNLADLPDASSTTTDDANAQWQADTEDAIDSLAQQIAALEQVGTTTAGTTATEINNGGPAGAVHPNIKAAKHATTNTSWAAAALKVATAHGISHTTAKNAITHYLNGGNLNKRQEAALVKIVGLTKAPPQAPKKKATATHHAATTQHPGAPKKQTVVHKVVAAATKKPAATAKKTEKAKAAPAKKAKKK